MKGHVGGGARVRRFQGVVHSVKLCRSYMSFTYPYVMGAMRFVLIASEENVQERLLEMRGSIVEFHCDLIGHKLESLIMAQNERWRHA